MATVYLATRGLELVAVKVLNSNLLSDDVQLARFSREAETLRLVEGPGVVRLLDSRVDSEEAWLALEVINGLNLRELVKRHGKFSEEHWWLFLERMASTLARVHDFGVVHRDVKPSNILMATDGPVIVDFGIADDMEATRLTKTGSFQGSPFWLSPEQWTGENITEKSDMFSLASSLVFAATGRHPWRVGDDAHFVALMEQITGGKPVLTGLSSEQKDILMPLFALDADDRPSSRRLLDSLPGGVAGKWPGGLWQPQPVVQRCLSIVDDPDVTVSVDMFSRLAEAAGQVEPERDLTRTLPDKRDVDLDTTTVDKKGIGKTKGDESGGQEEEERQQKRTGKQRGAKKTTAVPPVTKRTKRPHRDALVTLAVGVVLSAVWPAWSLVSGWSSNDAEPVESERLVLEWLGGDSYGDARTSARAVMVQLYSVNRDEIIRTQCVSEGVADAFRASDEPAGFQVRQIPGSGGEGTWVDVAAWNMSGEALVDLPPAGVGVCTTPGEVVAFASVSRDDLEPFVSDQPCVELRFQEPSILFFQAREEVWCAWLEGEPESSEFILRG